MYRISYITLFIVGLLATGPANAQNLWKPANAARTAGVNATEYLQYAASESALKKQLFSAGTTPSAAIVITLPMPDGQYRAFKVWRSSLIPDQLAAKYPGLSTFSAEAADNRNITAKIDYTWYGFHAIVFDGSNVLFIDPAGNDRTGLYTVHYKKNEVMAAGRSMHCQTSAIAAMTDDEVVDITKRVARRSSNGYVLRTYRLALACNHEYAQAATGLSSPTIEQALSKMTTTMNRVNGVYERELSVTMQFVANEDNIIWTTETGGVNGNDPFNGLNTFADRCIITNQGVCDSRIGFTSYDIGHVFTTGAGGLSQVAVVCGAEKAESATGLANPVGDGFDIDFVAHEMGHEFGGNHSFNNGQDDNCAGLNIYASGAYEPGSGSTIMAYAGICTPDNLQEHSDPYFHAVNLVQMEHFITTTGDVCAVKTPTGNKLVYLPPFNMSYTIPYLTPFEFTAPVATDSVGDTLITYCWEQWNLGDEGAKFVNTHNYGPIFRSFLPTTSPTRVFPSMEKVLAGVLSDAGINNNEGEKVPDVARFLTFKLTMRDILNGHGCFLIPDDSVHLDVANTGKGFSVTSQNTTGIVYLGHTRQNVTWEVAGTNGLPVNTPNVDIYMSADSGATWAYHIGTFANTGSAEVILPNPTTDTTWARLKVKGTGNVFFNVNAKKFMIIKNPDTTNSEGAKLYPVPARDIIYLLSGNPQDVAIFNSVGQEVYHYNLFGQLSIRVDSWARGVYIMRLIDDKKRRTIKKFVLE